MQTAVNDFGQTIEDCAIEIADSIISRHSLYDPDENVEAATKVRNKLVQFLIEQLGADGADAVPIDSVLGGMVWGLELAYYEETAP